MQISYFPMKAVRVTGSELSDTHIGTYNLDLSYAEDQWIYAPCDIIVKKVYHATTQNSNTTWFESLQPVKTKGFEDYVTFMMGHMYNADFNAMGIVVGKIFKQGERCYKAGMQGNATGIHVHTGWAKGKFTGTGWYRTPSGNWSINNPVHMWDAVYLRPGTQILKGSDAGYAYKDKWAYATTPANMVDIAQKGIKTADLAVNMRELPSTFYGTVGALPKNSLIPITQISTNFVDGFQWVKVEYDGIIGYSAVVASVQIVDILTTEEKLALALKEALAVIAQQKQTIDDLNKQVSEKDAELQSYSQVATVLYEKK